MTHSGLSREALAAHDKFENKTEEVDEAKLVISRILEKQLGHDFSATRARRSSGGCCAGCRSRNSTSWRATSTGCAAIPTKSTRCSVTS
jgi:hypothetical protein